MRFHSFLGTFFFLLNHHSATLRGSKMSSDIRSALWRYLKHIHLGENSRRAQNFLEGLLYVSYLAWEQFKVPPERATGNGYRERCLATMSQTWMSSGKWMDVQAYINTLQCT